MNAYVFFATGRWHRPGRREPGLMRRIRATWRRPLRSYCWLLGHLIRILSRSKHAHVCIGYDGVVLDAGITGNRFWPMIQFVSHYPTLDGCFVIPVRKNVGLARFKAERRRRPAFPTFLRWVTWGRWKADDFLTVVVNCLWYGHHICPMNLVSPRELFDWLESLGYQWIQINGETPESMAYHIGRTAG